MGAARINMKAVTIDSAKSTKQVNICCDSVSLRQT